MFFGNIVALTLPISHSVRCRYTVLLRDVGRPRFEGGVGALTVRLMKDRAGKTKLRDGRWGGMGYEIASLL